jgi:hypothetical protein
VVLLLPLLLLLLLPLTLRLLSSESSPLASSPAAVALLPFSLSSSLASITPDDSRFLREVVGTRSADRRGVGDNL